MEVGNGRAEGLSAKGDRRQAAISLMPDSKPSLILYPGCLPCLTLVLTLFKAFPCLQCTQSIALNRKSCHYWSHETEFGAARVAGN